MTKPGTIVGVRAEINSEYTVPVMIVEDRYYSVLVRFAAGNLRVVPWICWHLSLRLRLRSLTQQNLHGHHLA